MYKKTFVEVAASAGSPAEFPGRSRFLHEGATGCPSTFPAIVLLRTILVCCCAFWAPWGPAIILPGTSIGASKLFVASSCLLIAYWLAIVRRKFSAFPPAYNLLILFILLHSLVVYGFLHRGELDLSRWSDTAINESILNVEEGRGTLVFRFFFNATMAYAVAGSIRTRREIKYAAVSFCIGFILMIVLCSRSSISYSEGFYRLTGGFLNPNDFGLAAMTVVFFSALILLTPKRGVAASGIACLSLIAGLYGVLASASRSSMGGMAVGLVVLFHFSKASQKIRYVASGLLVILLVALFLSDETHTAISHRYSLETMRNTRGSMRMDIYRDYLVQLPRYVYTGVGLKRATEVTKDSYTTHKILIPHNAYIQYLVEFGGLGLLLFLLSLWQFFTSLKLPLRQKQSLDRRDVLMLGFLLAWAAMFFVGSADSRMFWFSWALLAAHRSQLLMPQGANNSKKGTEEELSTTQKKTGSLLLCSSPKYG